MNNIDCEFIHVSPQTNAPDEHGHAFVLAKNIELPSQDEAQIEDTYIDTTWDLARYKFGFRPQWFCLSWDDLQQKDDPKKSHNCTKSPSIGLDDKSLREIFKSLDLTDEHGIFPAKDLVDESNDIDKSDMSIQEKIEKKFKLLESKHPDFSHFLMETAKATRTLFKTSEKFDYKKLIIKKVYDKSDPEKRTILYTYFKLNDDKELFYYLDRAEEGGFKYITKEDFESRFECYEKDLKRNNNVRPWQKDESQQDNSISQDEIDE